MAPISIREFRYPEDYPAAIELWSAMERGVHVGPSDAPAEIEKKLRRDPDLFLVAEAEQRLIGTVIGGFDGRRGFVYHLAVAASFRRTGIGSRLMTEVESRLRGKGCIRCYLLVRPDNSPAIRHYENGGWKLLDDLLYAKDLA
jgi:ribosomal protein S18 acetylase RimI-like enzyme